jgi:hypothetical protein
MITVIAVIIIVVVIITIVIISNIVIISPSPALVWHNSVVLVTRWAAGKGRSS